MIRFSFQRAPLLEGVFGGSSSAGSLVGPPPFTVTPQYQSLLNTAQNDQVNELMQQARADSASLMARYGTRLALAGTSGSLATPTATPGR